MYCHKCGASVPDGMKFCHKCGVALPTLTYGMENAADAPQPVAPTLKESVLPVKKSNRKKSMTWIIPAAIAALLIVAFIALYYGTGAAVKNKANSVYYLEAYDSSGFCLGSGSGFVIGDGCDMVTNFHVIAGASKIIAISADESEEIVLNSVKAYNKNADLAILKRNTPFQCKPLSLANSDAVRQGDRIYAIGYPLGLSNTLSDGIVSARYIDTDGIDTLQITAAISPGSSGGALLNTRGQVVGVVCAYYVDGQNLNVAIASNTLKKLNEWQNAEKPLSSVS